MLKIKCCTKCGIKKPITEFNKNINYNDGYTSQCKRCNALYIREKRIKEGMTKPIKSFDSLGISSIKTDHLYSKKIKNKIKLPYFLCDILQHHSEDLKDDPQKLSSDFIAEILFCHEERYYIKYLKTKTFTNNL